MTEDDRDDFELMAAIDAGDVAGLTTLFRRHGGTVYAVCVRVLGDRHEAEDVLLDVFWEAWRKSGRYHPSRGAPRTYLVTLRRSRAIDRKRSLATRGGSARGSSPDDTPREASREETGTSSDAALEVERRRLVQEAVANLDDSQREAVSLAFFDGLTHREIAERLETPLGTIKTRIRSGLARLREALDRHFSEREPK